MKGFLLILLLSFFPALQCQDYNDKSNHFFVTRRDNKEAICIGLPGRAFTLFPTFDLDKLQIPRDVGIKYWDWLADWQLQNYRNVRRREKGKVLFAGNQPFQFVARVDRGTRVYILASNVTLWMANENRPRGAGMLFELDHLNEKTKLKDTTFKFCTQNPEKKKANCTILDYKNGTNYLNDGNHWIQFDIHLKENRTGVVMIDWSYGKYKPVVQCIWNNTNISNLFSPLNDFEVYAKSHQRNAALRTYGFNPNLSSNIEMKRNYTKRSSGKFCVEVEWYEEKSIKDSKELMQVKNLASGRRVEPATKTTHIKDLTYFRWNHLDAGEYEFTLRFDKRQPWDIDLCPDDVSMMRKTWTSIPKAITKCQFGVGETYELSAGPSSPPDPTLKPRWSFEEWAYVCEQLGILSNDAEVQIKFCNLKGCNFSKCPHLQHEPAYIFDF